MDEKDNLPEESLIRGMELPTIGNTLDINPVDYVYDSVKAKANEVDTLLEIRDKEREDLSYYRDFFNSAAEPKKVSFQEGTINIDDAYTRLSDGTYITRYDEGFLAGANNEEIYAQRQSTSSKWLNGLGKFVGKTAVNVVGGTIGTAWGAISAIGEGNWENIYDNSFYDMLDDYNTKMDNSLAANYRTQEEQNMGFFESATTANFWADDFLGGASFLVGTVLSEATLAAATGGISLAVTAGRYGLKASKYLNAAKDLTKGIKAASNTYQKFNRADNILHGLKNASKFGKVGELAHAARFAYTSAGFESGMEARLYQKEQEANFYRDFEEFNGRKPTPLEVTTFKDNLDKTTNALFATNMALVGSSNLAVLGKAFNVQSPFKLSKKSFDKYVFGKGVTTKTGDFGERVSTEAIKKTKLQRGLGVASGLLKAPIYEGLVEEGGQAMSSNAMEQYLTSRYNPNKEALDVAEAFYNGFSETYGTKEGWKEIGLGMLIGMLGGGASNVLQGQNFFEEAVEGWKEQDTQSVGRAQQMNAYKGTDLVNQLVGSKLGVTISNASQIVDIQSQLDKAEATGDLMGRADAQSRLMLASAQQAVELDYLDDQVADFKTALEIQAKAEEGKTSVLADNFGIPQSEVKGKIDELTSEFRRIGERYQEAKRYTDYLISDNPKDLGEKGTQIDVENVKQGLAFQLTHTSKLEEHLDDAHNVLIASLSEVNQTLASEFDKTLTEVKKLHSQGKEYRQKRETLEKKIELKKSQLDKINQDMVLKDAEWNKKAAPKVMALQNELTDLQGELTTLESNLETRRENLSSNARFQQMASELDAIDSSLDTNVAIEPTSIKSIKESLNKIDSFLKNSKYPKEAAKIDRLINEYNKGLNLWTRSSELIADLTNPEMGLDKIKSIFKKGKEGSQTTLEFLQKLEKTNIESVAFIKEFEGALSVVTSDTLVEEYESNQQKEANDIGEDILAEEDGTVSKENAINKLKRMLKEILTKSSYLLENFTNDSGMLVEDKKPTEKDLEDYLKLRKDFEAGDINKLLGRPVSEISARVKKRSGLTDEQIERYQELSRKMTDWRIVTGTSIDGTSIQDILDEIDAHTVEIQSNLDNPTKEQQVEIAKMSEQEFSIGMADFDITQRMSHVHVAKSGDDVVLAHFKIESLEEEGYQVSYLRDDNVGTEKDEVIHEVYRISKDGKEYEIRKEKDSRSRIYIPSNISEELFSDLGLDTKIFKLKTAWSPIFKNGELMPSQFEYTDTESVEATEESVYNLKPGDKVRFAVSISNDYNKEEIVSLIENGQLKEAEAKLAIYVLNSDGEVVSLLKAGKDKRIKESNFNNIRKEAFKLFEKQIKDRSITIDDLVNDDVNTIFELPYETEVSKVFIGTPNMKLDDNGDPIPYKITKEQSDNHIVGFGYSIKGEFPEKNTNVRKTFIPKDKDVPYVIIKQGETLIAFPVGLNTSSDAVKNEVMGVLSSDATTQNKKLSLIGILRKNGLDSTLFDLDSLLEGDSNALTDVMSELENSRSSYTKEDIDAMSKEEFTERAEIIIDLDNPAFVSPKIKIDLSKTLTDLNSKETTSDKEVSKEEKIEIIKRHPELTLAKNKQEVADIVASLTVEEPLLEKLYIEDSNFRKTVDEFALGNNAAPSIVTAEMLEEELLDMDVEDTNVAIGEDVEADAGISEVKNNPSLARIKNVAKRLKEIIIDKFAILPKNMSPEHVYHIPTHQTETKMFEAGFVRLTGDFWKKVDKKYSVEELKQGLYEKYKKGTLPKSVTDVVGENASQENFNDSLPNNLLELYKIYYNSQPLTYTPKTFTVGGRENYLKEALKKELSEYTIEQRKLNTPLYQNVLQHLNLRGKNITKSDLLDKETLDKWQDELGDFYYSLIDYSLINKHIDFGITSENVIFVEDVDLVDKLDAINSPSLPKIKGEVTLSETEGEIVTRSTNPFYVKYENKVYEKVGENSQGGYLYKYIADIDPNFLITEIDIPFTNTVLPNNKQTTNEGTKINGTKGTEIKC